MRYTLTITGETAHPALVQKIADVLALALGGAPGVDLVLAADPTPRASGPVDFATEPVAVTIDLADTGTSISVSARDGDVVAAGATVDAAMSSIGTLPASVDAQAPAPVANAPVADAAAPDAASPVIASSKEAT